MAAAWIIEWSLHRRDLPILDLRPHILPRYWRAGRVMDYMQCLFWNSALWAPSEALRSVNKRKPEGIFIMNEGPRLIYGDATHLIAWLVKDLRIERGAAGEIVMEWTALPGSRFNSKTRTFEPLGKPLRRRFVWNR